MGLEYTGLYDNGYSAKGSIVTRLYGNRYIVSEICLLQAYMLINVVD